ncbi:TetR/AcrR family transcriptional regulator [Actinomadura violacea]|uniref:TetR/AcrR family transcriptional regulator n=1 Tax=Actinomadura violacea TaxID=2819934 RepID=A0ABS3S834_9ACTN|nr:TetR/AcrR family transcriptional regulator [Actinomadura violacea]MBO2465051.1 TetR/AcrR family transcriptional regulator [Actinomadura violacea]
MTPAPNPERRNERSRRATLDATIALVGDRGYAKVTIEAIAARAGVSKQTIYRWWSSKAALALEAINDFVGEAIDFPDTGDIAADLVQQLNEVTRLLKGPIGTVFRGVVADAQGDPAIGAALRESITEPRTRLCEKRLAAAITAGQLRADVPTRVMTEMLYSVVYYRLLFGTDALDVRDTPQLLEYTLSGLRPQ